MDVLDMYNNKPSSPLRTSFLLFGLDFTLGLVLVDDG